MTRTTIRSEDITAGQVKSTDLASDAVDTTGIQTDIAILGFKVAANGSLAKYDLVDQTIDDFQDASGVDASASTDEVRNASNYYSGLGGVGTSGSNSYTSSGTFTHASVSSANILVVGAGGGGSGSDWGGDSGGGAGGGGIVHHATYPMVGGVVYDITVGTGGTAGANTGDRTGGSGGNSSFNDNAEGSQAKMTALGGGGGSAGAGVDGGCGGAPGRTTTTQGVSIQTDSGGGTGYGNDGGNGGVTAASAGGGGGGANGAVGSGTTGGAGGAGKLFSDFTSWGSSGYFSGGGGGGGTSTGGSGGSGGGASGGSGSAGNTATANTGGGGGGAGNGPNIGGVGGSGIVIIKWVANVYNDMTLISNATTAEAVPTKGDLVMTYTNGAGTATVNTDIKGWVSRDNGTTYTQFTLADEGDTGGHTILTAHDLDISGQPSGTAMRYKITTHNQSASKETRIQAVSLGWS